jgi:hypothetical protein
MIGVQISISILYVPIFNNLSFHILLKKVACNWSEENGIMEGRK